MYRDALASLPSIPQCDRERDLPDLFDDVEVAETVRTCGVIGECTENILMFLAKISNRMKPLIDESEAIAGHYRSHTAAPIVAADDHIVHSKHVYRVLQYRQAVHIRLRDEVRNIPVDEQLTRPKVNNLVGRHSAI